jgi:hypothetical protein
MLPYSKIIIMAVTMEPASLVAVLAALDALHIKDDSKASARYSTAVRRGIIFC